MFDSYRIDVRMDDRDVWLDGVYAHHIICQISIQNAYTCGVILHIDLVRLGPQ